MLAGSSSNILKKKGIKYKDRRIISSLYRDYKAVEEMQAERGETSIKKGVRQGCSLSPSLFNIYSKEAINKIKKEIKNIGVKVQGETIKMLRFADDKLKVLVIGILVSVIGTQYFSASKYRKGTRGGNECNGDSFQIL